MSSSKLPVYDDLAGVIGASGRSELGFWQDAIDSMSEALMIVSPERRILFANEQARGLMRVPLEEAKGRPCLETMDCPQCGCMCRLFEQGAIDNVEVTVHTPEPKIFRKNGRLLRNADGEVIGGIETFADITKEHEEREARERRDELLLRERRCHSALLAEVSEGVFSLDEHLCIRDFSEHMTQLTGFSSGEAAGRPFFELLDVQGIEDTSCPEALAENRFDVTIMPRSGTDRAPLRLSFLPLRFGSDTLLGLARPCTAQPTTAAALERAHGFAGMLSRSPVMQDLFRLLENVANSDANVMIEGESGAGKELVARAVHTLSARTGLPFYAVNCATFTGSLLLSELFGHERGAFTGAYKTQRGKLELADGGTLLLDEVSEIPIQHQALLLRVLESRRFERLGGTTSIPFSARVLAATNRPLAEAVQDKTFRRDLFFRLNVVPVRVPPLRERPEDVALLLEYFSLRHGKKNAKEDGLRVSPKALRALESYPWPGNVRELKNLVEYFCFVCDDEITEAHLPSHLVESGLPAPAPTPEPQPARPAEPAAPPAPEAVTVDLPDERSRIVAALEEAKYKKARAAKLLGIDRTTLWRRMKKLGIEGE